MAPRREKSPGRTIAQVFAVLVGVVLIAVGAFGFLVNASFDQAQLDIDFTGDPVTGDLFLGLFEVNGWHNIVHIASGALLLVGGLSRTNAPRILLLFGVVYAAVTVWGFIDQRNVLDLIPVNTADNVLHAALTALALVVGLIGVAEGRRRSSGRPAVPVTRR